MMILKLNEMRALAGWHLTYSLALRFLLCGCFYYSKISAFSKEAKSAKVSSLLYNNMDLIRYERINSAFLTCLPVIRCNYA